MPKLAAWTYNKEYNFYLAKIWWKLFIYHVYFKFQGQFNHNNCGVIKQNESEVSQIKFSISGWLFTWFVNISFTIDSTETGQLVPKIHAVEGLQNQ